MSQNLTYKKFGDIASFSRGLTFAKGDVATSSSKKVLRSNNIDLHTHTLNFDDVACLKEEFIIPNEKKLHKGDIFICMSNGSTQHLGKVAFIDKDMDYAFGGFMGVIHPDNTTIYPKYAFYACLSSEYRRFLASILNGININNLKWSDLSNLQIPIPPLQEQERIVAELDLLTEIIDKQKQQLKELDNLAQSIFYDMFGSVDNNTKNFMVKCLNEVFQLITDGTHQTPQYTDDILHGFKFLSAKDVVSGVIDWTRIKYIPESLHNELYKRLAPRRGDILLCKNGTTGICALVETDEVFDIYVSLALLRTEKEYNKKYLVYAINNPSTKSQFDDSLKGVGVPNLHLGEIKKTKILVPPIELQSSFAKKIESIESQKEFINRSIAESQKLFDYTMDKYFG